MNADDTIGTRASLLDRLKNHEDQASWQEFFDTYWRLIYSVAIKSGLGDAEAQDVVQETVISVARKVGGFRYDPRVCSFKTWMLQVTRWRILDRIRRRERQAAGLGRRVHLSQRTSPAGCPAPSADDTRDQTATLDRLPDPEGINLEEVWDTEWRQTLFHAALEAIRTQVPPDQYQIFHLYAVKELPARQVARMAGVGIASVYLTKHRIAALLKREVRSLETKLLRRLSEP